MYSLKKKKKTNDCFKGLYETALMLQNQKSDFLSDKLFYTFEIFV